MRFILSILMLSLSLSQVLGAQTLPPLVDEAFADYAALPGALVPILAEARDKESADAAADKLFALLPQVYDARSALHRIPSLGETEAQAVRQKYEAQLRSEWGKLFEHIYRLQKAKCYGSLPFFKHFQTLCLMLEK